MSAGDLIYRLEEALEKVQQAATHEEVSIICHFSFLDVRCKKLVFKYLKQIEEQCQNKPNQRVLIVWRYDWFDDDIIQFGLLAEEEFHLEFEHVEFDTADLA